MVYRNTFRRQAPVLVILLILAIAASASALSSQPETMSTTVIPSKDRPITTLRDLNQAFIDVAKAVTPTVVTVSIEKIVKARVIDPFSQLFGDQFGGDPFGFGGQGGQGRSPERQFKQQGLGSGVIVTSDGYILTNNHVVSDADSITVRLYDGRTFHAKVIGTDPKTDVAVIKVNATGLPAIQRGNSDSLQVGEMVMAIGSPLSENLAHTVTQGIVSAKGRSNLDLAQYEDFIQTDAAINPGNSGGALVNLDGQLVGINTAILTQSGGFQGIGLAVPINMALRIMDALIKNGKVVRGYLGVSIQDVSEPIARAMHLEGQKGALVGDVAADGPAQKAGLKDGDIIMKMDGKDIATSTQLRNEVASTAPGTVVTLSVLRDGKYDNMQVTLGELPSGGTPAAMRESLSNTLGFKAATLDRQLADKYSLNPKLNGVVVTDIDQNSSAFAAGLREGDLIRSVNHTRVADLTAFTGVLANVKQGDTVLMQVIRQDSGFYLAFTL